MRFHRSAARWATTGLAAVLLGASLFLVHAAEQPADLRLAASGDTYLCSGYSGCRSAGYSDAGYSGVNNRMYWRMYAGHNCTNYAAYRVIKNGGPASRPWSGGGNASQWGLEMREITDQTPNVGAIAWWARYDNGSGSAGHVAYVEKVVSSTEIIVSQDSWGGTFSWRRIKKSSGRWPTGFIHFTDKSITATKRPSVTGAPTVGRTLTATAGSWSVRPSKIYYNWLVGGRSAGVYTSTFTPRAADLGKPVTVRVRARRSGYADGVQVTTPTSAVAEGSFVVPTDATVSGQPYVGEVLTATTGTWTPDPERVGWRWYADGRRIKNQGPKLTLTAAMAGKTITVAPAAVLRGYTTAATQPLDAGVVVQGKIAVDAPARLQGSPLLGHTLTVADAATSPDGVTRTYQWFRDGVKIRGAQSKTYRVTSDDLGKRIAVRTFLERAGWDGTIADAPTLGRSMSPGRVKIGVDRLSARKIRVRVRVRAPQIDQVRGEVRLRIHRRVETLRLHDGRVWVTLTFRSGGAKEIVADYLGAKRVATDSASTSIRIR